MLLDPQTIISSAIYACGITHEIFTGASRDSRVVECRRIVAYLMKKRTVLSYPDIAKAMRRPTHSTVMNQAEIMSAAYRMCPATKELVDLVENMAESAVVSP